MRTRSLGFALAALLAAPLSAVGGVTTGPAPAAAAGQPYSWKNVEIGGGGFVPGIVYSRAKKGLAYARTDIGGAYRMDPGSSRWVPLLDWVGADTWGYNGVVSIAPDPTNARKVYAAVGMYTTDWDPNNGAILRSANKGRTWSVTKLPFKLGGNMPGRGMGERLAVDPNNPDTLYFGAPSGKGLWRSTDAGVTWKQVTAFPNPGTYVAKAGDSYQGDIQGVVWVTFDPRSGGKGTGSRTIYVGVADLKNSIYRSTDGGKTWGLVPGAPSGYLPHKGVLDEKQGKLYVATSDTGGPYDGAKGQVWRYDTRAGTWADISPVPVTSGDDYFGYSGLTVDRQHPGTLMVATQVSWWPDAIFFRSTDAGATWTRIWDFTSYPSRSFRYTLDISDVPWLTFNSTPQAPEVSPKLGWMNESVEIDPFDSDRLMYGTGATIYGTANLTAWDKGGTILLKPVVAGLEETAVLDLISPPSGPSLVSGLGDIGGFVHKDLTKIPNAMFGSPTFTTTTSLDYAETKPSVLVRAGSFTDADRPQDSHVAFSTDSGATWTQGQEPSGVNEGGTVAASADGARFVWAPKDVVPVVSEGLGYSWTPVKGLPTNAVVESDRVNPKTFYGLSGGKVYVSTDGGATFAESAAAVPGVAATATKLHAVPGHEGDLWVAAGDGGLFRSTDGAATFTKVRSVSGAVNLGFGKAAPGKAYQALYLIGTVGKATGAFRSDDGGRTWVRINDAKHQYGNWGEAITGDPRVYGRVYVGTNGRGVLVAQPQG